MRGTWGTLIWVKSLLVGGDGEGNVEGAGAVGVEVVDTDAEIDVAGG